MNKIFLLFFCISAAVIAEAQNVGVGTTTPAARLHVRNGSSKGTITPSTTVVVESSDANYIQFTNPEGDEAAVISGTNFSALRSGIFFDADSAIRLRAGGFSTRLYVGAYGNIGIGTTVPAARLQVLDSNVVFSASGSLPNTPGDPPIQGVGRRMMWYANKAAFRVGSVSSDLWDQYNTGYYSFASGKETMASGQTSTAMGNSSHSTGDFSTSMGAGSLASGFVTTAMGGHTIASNDYATAMGRNTIARGFASTAMGYGSTASGSYSTAMGFMTTASGEFSTVMGRMTTASGDQTIAFGSSVSTNNHKGALMIGDASTGVILNALLDNSFTARFAEGYKLFTNAATSVGVQVAAGGNAWTTISDSSKKENFAEINQDDFLRKISKLKLVSWNYKGQDPKTFRHYGPMAQEFFEAFGKDNYGSVGNDTTINQADFDGVNLIAIQALEKRTARLQEENALLAEENKLMKARLERLERLFAANEEK